MSLIVLGFVIIIVISSLLFIKEKAQDTSESIDYPYSKQEILSTPVKHSFLGVLTQAIGDKAKIFRLDDIHQRINKLIKYKTGLFYILLCMAGLYPTMSFAESKVDKATYQNGQVKHVIPYSDGQRHGHAK